MPQQTTSLRDREFAKILLIKMSAVGDVVHTIPVLNKLRRRYGAARIDWLITPAIAELLKPHPAISNVVLFERNEWAAPWRGSAFASSARLAARLRSVGYDLVLDLHGQLRTAVFTFATGAPVRIGFDRPRPQVWKASGRTLPAEARRHAWKGAREGSWLAYTHHIPVPTLDVHAVDRYLSVGPILGLDDEPADFSFPVPAAAMSRVEWLLGGNGIDARQPLLTLAPGTIWETKHWRTEGFADVARHFMQKGFAAVLIGSAREHGACAAVATLVPGAVNLAGQTTLSDLAALIRSSMICVTNDSGPMHLAVALDRPVVSIFGPTDAIWVGPYRRSDAVLQADLPCAPCYLRRLSRCPHDHGCMRAVSAQDVINRAEAWLAKAGDGQTRDPAAASGERIPSPLRL